MYYRRFLSRILLLLICIWGGESNVYAQDMPKLPAREGRIPSIYLETEDVIRDKETYVDGTARFLDPDGWYSDQSETVVPMKIRFRGKLSLKAPEKSYRIRLEKETPVFGMPSDRNWALIANYFDKSLLRNKLAMKISEIAGMAWTPKCRTCDIYLNGEYMGCYDLFQHKAVSPEKVNIVPVKKEEAPDEGSYYLGIEATDPDFRTPVFQIPIVFSNPSFHQLSEAHRTYVRARFLEMERALKENPASGLYRQYLDLPSFARLYIIQELSKNIDGVVRKSDFLVLTPGKPMTIYHVWDFDLAFGNVNYMPIKYMPASLGHRGDDPEGFFIKDVSESGLGNGLMQYLFRDPAFVAEVKKAWEEMFPGLQKLTDWLREEAAVYDEPYRRDFQRWASSRFRNRYEPAPHATSYDAARDRLISFYERRLAWMDEAVRSL